MSCLRASDRKSSVTNSLLIGTSRRLVPTERSVDDWIGQRHVLKGRGTQAQVRRRLCMSIRDLELDSLRDEQPMEAGQRVGDVVGSPQVIDQPRSTDWSGQTR